MNNVNVDVVKVDFEKLVNLYSEIETLQGDIKVLKESLKEEGCNVSLLCKIAQAKAKDKTGKLQESTEELLELLEIVA